MRAISAARAFILALVTCWAFAAAADVAVPPLTGRVVDLTGTLSSTDVATLTQKLKDLEARKGSQIAVLIVPTTQPETIEQYSLRVAEAWKIGRRRIDDGALLVIAKNDHKLRIEVGYGLEGALTDVTSRRIIDEVITPKFRRGDFAGGISDGVTRIVGVVDGEPLPAPAPEASHGRDSGVFDGLDPFNPFVIIAVLGLAGFLRSALGRLVGSVAVGGVAGVLAWLFVGSIAASAIVGLIAFVFALMFDMFSQFGPPAGYRGRGGWVGGGYGGGSYSGRGWSGGSGSSGDGGFSGGGGSFGGGGASGSW